MITYGFSTRCVVPYSDGFDILNEALYQIVSGCQQSSLSSVASNAIKKQSFLLEFNHETEGDCGGGDSQQ